MVMAQEWPSAVLAARARVPTRGFPWRGGPVPSGTLVLSEAIGRGWMSATDVPDSDLAGKAKNVPVEVASVGSRTEADLIVGLLRSNGVRAVVLTDDAGGQEPQWQLSGVRVVVSAADAETARALLAAPLDDG
jgi:Putative prokaryotic signal transducing protein